MSEKALVGSLIVGQSGGPTSVINASLAGVYESCTSIVSTFFDQVEKLKKGETPESVVLKSEFMEGESLS